MVKLSKKKIEATYKMLQKQHEEFLKEKGVIMPKLKKGGKYTKFALALIYLAQDYPNTRVVSKSELTSFIKIFDKNVNDVQQARHLGAQKGWYINSGTRDDMDEEVKKGEYRLVTLKEAYPDFKKQKRVTVINDDDWEKLKKAYGYRCACCGSVEGQPHLHWKNTITKIQKGHMDPNKPLKEGNIIPQCQKCNQPDLNYWIYNDKGRVISIANAKVVDKCSEQVKEDIFKRLSKNFKGKSPHHRKNKP